MRNFIHKLISHNEVNLNRQSNNFDLLRLLAAILVIISHSPHVLSLSYLEFDPFKEMTGNSMGRFGVQIFFIISGFLVAYSWEKKKSIFDYIMGRVLRIYPAAIVIVLLCVFILGPLMTSKTFSEYFNHSLTFQYIQNTTIFRMYYYLPGVFNSNPSHSINASLWTLPYEFGSYIVLGIIGFFHILRKKISMILFFSSLLLADLFFSSEIKTIIIPIVGIDFKTFYPLFLYFASGSFFYVLRNKIRLNTIGLIISLILLYLLKDNSFSKYFSILLLPYIILTIAFYKPLLHGNQGRFGDLSYGLYLYSFPVQQLIVHFFGTEIPLLLTVILSILFTFPFAFLSWIIVEKPSLRLRTKFNNIKLFTTTFQKH